MRIHTLQSVWSAGANALTRRLFEGGHLDNDPMGLLASSEEEQAFCADEWLNGRLAALHRLARAGYGQNIQAHIDTFLPAVAYSRAANGQEQQALARRMVLCISDSPQEGTLPDLGSVLRGVMLGFRPPCPRSGAKAGLQPPGCAFPHAIADDCYATHMLLQALPCIKQSNRKDKRELRGHQIGLNVLLGFLLGLCPSAVKFPPFPVRVTVYASIHRLLTCGSGKAFCEAHPMLMTMAFMEHCAHVLPSYMPAEHEILLSSQGMPAFFSGLPVASDVFRQEMLNNMAFDSSIQWEKLEAHCEATVDKHTRACKNRVKQKRDEHGISSRVPRDVVRAFASLPYVTPYDIHLDDGMHRILGSELAVLDQTFARPAPACIEEAGSLQRGGGHETVAAMQRLLCVSPLPANVVRMQLRSLGACMGVCERSALDGMALYICVACGLCSGGASRSAQTRGQCRLDGALFSAEAGCAGAVNRSGLVCSHCQTPSVLAVNTLGRVVTLRNQRFFLAPCCCTVQAYGGSGGEFHSEYCFEGGEGVSRGELSGGVTLHVCQHQRKRPQQRPQRARCEVCQTTSSGAVAPEVFTAVDHLVGCMRSIRLCSRRAPRAESLKQVANWAQLMAEVNKRDRPLFASSRK